jgi:hypothetical protein
MITSENARANSSWEGGAKHDGIKRKHSTKRDAKTVEQ